MSYKHYQLTVVALLVFATFGTAFGEEHFMIRIAPEGTVFETFADQAYYQGFTEEDRITNECYQKGNKKFCQEEDGISLTFSTTFGIASSQDIEWDTSEGKAEFIEQCLEKGGELSASGMICKTTNPNPNPINQLIAEFAMYGIYVLGIGGGSYIGYLFLKLYLHAKRCPHCKSNIITTLKDDCSIGDKSEF